MKLEKRNKLLFMTRNIKVDLTRPVFLLMFGQFLLRLVSFISSLND